MVKNNEIPIEVNKKPFETVYEIKDEYKVLSWEEFEKNYQEGNLNYEDLSEGSVGEVGGMDLVLVIEIVMIRGVMVLMHVYMMRNFLI